nr:flagellar basal body rod C-terminal domain-containing protein [Stakelama flava]
MNDILGSALSGLGAAQSGLRTVSTNIANVGTPGYARERVTQAAGVTAGRVSGVVVSQPERVADRFLEAAAYMRATEVGLTEARSDYLDRAQALLGAPGSESSLPARLDAISSAAIAMTGSLGASQNAADFVAKTSDSIASMQQLDSDIESLTSDADQEVGSTVERINTLLSRIYDLNSTVSRLDGLGKTSAGSVDQRNAAVEELSSLMAVNVRLQPNGRVNIDTAGGAPLIDSRLRLLSYPNGGAGSAQPGHPGIEIRFADSAGGLGVATGDRIESSATGGKLGGLLDLRDRTLPALREQMGSLFTGLARTLNEASNAASAVPAPSQLVGANTPFASSDRLGFTGSTVFAVTAADGTVTAKTTVDFDSLGTGATIADAVAAINAGLGGAGTATFANGTLSISANGTGQGIAVADDPDNPAQRAGVGFSQFFGLNDLIRSDDGILAPTGLTAADPHGFSDGQTVGIELRDGSGRILAQTTLTPTGGGTMGDLLDDLNSGPMGQYGSFRIDDAGRFRFEANAAFAGSTISVPVDSTDRLGTGASFSMISGLSGLSSGLRSGEVRTDIRNDTSRLPLAFLDTSAAVGASALGSADTRGAQGYADALSNSVDLGKDGVLSLERFSNQLLGKAGTEASQAQDRLADATARRDDAVNRRDSYSGVNIDEELSQMVVLQNSYSAAARVMTTASEMYQTLIAMMG